jgi:hypothetical protein
MRLTNKDVKPRAATKLNKSIRIDGGAMTFGEKDDYPNVIETVISSSITAVSAANIYAKYLTGQGFTNQSLNNIVVSKDNRGKEVRLLDMLRLCSESVSYFNGVYIHTPLNLEGQIAEPTLLSFKHCRFSKIDDVGYTNSILFNKNFGQDGFKAKDTTAYPVFNSNKKVIEDQIIKAKGVENYRGQIYFQFWDNRYLYPLSPFDPVYLDADTEWQVSLYKNRELRNGFMLKHLIRVGQFENEEARERFIDWVENTEGADGSRVGILEDEYDQETGEIKESGVFQVEKVDTGVDDKLFENWESSLSNKIRKANKALPAILIDYENSQLGTTSGEAIVQASNFYNAMTNDDRTLMSRVFSEIFSRSNIPELANNTDWSIKPLTLYEEKVEQSVDEAEIKKLESQATLKGSVGGVTALLELQQAVSAGTADLNAAVEIVKEIYGFDDATARRMIGTPEKDANKEGNV